MHYSLLSRFTPSVASFPPLSNVDSPPRCPPCCPPALVLPSLLPPLPLFCPPATLWQLPAARWQHRRWQPLLEAKSGNLGRSPRIDIVARRALFLVLQFQSTRGDCLYLGQMLEISDTFGQKLKLCLQMLVARLESSGSAYPPLSL